MNNIKLENKDLRDVLTIIHNNWSIDKCDRAKVLYEKIQSQISDRGLKWSMKNTKKS